MQPIAATPMQPYAGPTPTPMPAPTPMQPITTSGGAPDIVVRSGGQVVGTFAGGSGGAWQSAASQMPQRETQHLREEMVRTTTQLKEWREQMGETHKTGKDFLTKLKEWVRPEAAVGEGRAGMQAQLMREFAESRQRFAAAGWQDPYAGAAQEIQGLAPGGREGGAIRPTAWDRWSIRGQIAGMREQLEGMAPANRQESLQSAVFAMYAAKRGWELTGGQLQQWMGQYGQYDIAQQQAQFALGGQVPAMGAYQQQQIAGARMANLQASLGQSAWQNFGFLSGTVGTGQVGPTPLTNMATMGLGLVTPWAASKLAGGALAMAGAKGAAGFAAGVMAPIAATGAAVLGGVGIGGEVARALGADVEPGLGGTLGALSRIGRETAFVATQAAGRVTEPLMERLGIPQVSVQEQMERQLRVLGLMPGKEAQKQSPLAMLSEQQRRQLEAQATAAIGQAPTTRLMETLAERGPLMGFEKPEQYLQQLQQLALRGGYMPGGPGMGGALQELAGAGPTGLLQAQAAAPMMGRLQELMGTVPGGMVGFSQQYAQMTGPQRRQFEQFVGGNQIVVSEWARAHGRQDLVTMEEGGLPIYTTEMRAMQDTMTQGQRGYRDWQAQQQWTQMQATQAYTQGTWGLEDRQRTAQYAQANWQYGFQQQQFAQTGRQWYEQFGMQGRQQMEQMGLSRQMFESRVGWQQQDVGLQQGRMQQQYQWQMQDWTRSENLNQLQYGWQMEDLSTSIRFATGRERRQLMKQQERATISESMRREGSEETRERLGVKQQWEEEDFERSKQRNEELVGLQREQFEMQKRHWEESREVTQRQYEEDRSLQLEQMEKQREFYLQGREFDEERIKRERDFWEKQQKWQEESWKQAQLYNKEMDKLQDQYKNLQREQQDTVARFQEMLALGRDWAEIVKGAMGGVATSEPTTNPAAGAGSRVPKPRQLGGYVEHPEMAALHEGEYVVPRSGQLVLKEDGKGVEVLNVIAALIKQLVAIGQSSQQAVVVVQTNDAQRAKEHVLSLNDASYGLWPS